MRTPTRWLTLLTVALALCVLVLPATAKESFKGSDDAKENDEPQEYLPDYDKLMKGSNADWVYFPEGGLKEKFKTVAVKEFGSNGKGDHKVDAKRAAEYAKDFMTNWLKEQGFSVVEDKADVVIEGNVFNAWEPSGAARFWGGWMANPGCGIEILAKDGSGKIVAEIRHKSRGSTIRDAVENGLEEISKSLAKGK